MGSGVGGSCGCGGVSGFGCVSYEADATDSGAVSEASGNCVSCDARDSDVGVGESSDAGSKVV